MSRLAALARHGRLLLIAGLVVGAAWPALAEAMRPAIAPLIALLLFLAALRVGPAALTAGLRDLPRATALVLLFQTGLPLAAFALLTAVGAGGSVLGLGIVLTLAASPITGSPSLAILSGADPAPALRQLVLGTALLPLTALPVFWLTPLFPDPAATLRAAGALLAIIAAAGGAALLLRRAVPRLGSAEALGAIDGLSALAMAVVVIGLMSAVGPALLEGGARFWGVLALALALNFGLQAGVWTLARRAGAGGEAPALGLAAGNRNLALFLGALPPETAGALLLYIGCYQAPMYLTPLVMGPLYRRAPPASPAPRTTRAG